MFWLNENMKMYQEVVDLIAEGGSGVLVTLVAADGAAPVKPGTKMLVQADGGVSGTVGGGSNRRYSIMAQLVDPVQERSLRAEFSGPPWRNPLNGPLFKWPAGTQPTFFIDTSTLIYLDRIAVLNLALFVFSPRSLLNLAVILQDCHFAREVMGSQTCFCCRLLPTCRLECSPRKRNSCWRPAGRGSIIITV